MMKRCVLLGVLATVATIFLVFGVSKEISASTEQTGAYELYTSPVGYEDYFSDENPYTPPSENLKINPIYCPALKTGQMPTVDFFEWSLSEKGIYAHTADGTPLYLNGIGGGTVEGNWNKPGVYTVFAILSDRKEGTKNIYTILPVIIEAHDSESFSGY